MGIRPLHTHPQMNDPAMHDHESSDWVRRVLRCETLEQCRRIQHGSLFFRRMGKWSVLATVGITLFISDCVAAITNILQQVEATTTSFVYRWTVGWFITPPKVDWSLIAAWKMIDTFLFVIFLGFVVLAIRWVYADCVVNGINWIGFGAYMAVAALTNLIVYFALRSYLPV